MADEFDLSKKKKKKKKPLEVEEGEKKAEGDKEDTPPTAATGTEDIDFGAKKKKKKKPGVPLDSEESASTPAATEDATDSSLEPWTHTYDDLLKRVYDIMRAKNPGFESGEKKKIMMKPPQVMRVGSKKTAFVNFHELCKTLKREPKHVLQFLLAELGTSGSVDGNNQLIIKGRFQQKQFESVLKNYIREYVGCHTCRSAETVLQKESETRLYFLKCGTCGSRCSVAAIKTGFQAVTGKRAAARAAAGI